MTGRRKTLLMVASSLNPDLLRTPRDFGLEVVLAASQPGADPSLYDTHLAVNEQDEDALLAAVRGHLRAGGRVDAVACFHEGAIHAAARVTAELGLPGNSPEAVLIMRDKHRTAQVLTAAGVGAPRSVVVDSAQAAVRAARQIGLPAVVKPQSSACSQAVTKVNTENEAAAAYEAVAGVFVRDDFREGDFGVPNIGKIFFHPRLQRVVVQEFLDGPEFAVDMVYGNGAYEVLGIHAKPSQWGQNYFIERTYIMPPDLPSADLDAIADTATRALRAVGASTGGAHVEVRLTAAGPKVIEVNGRLGGTTAYVQESIKEATGVWGPAEYLRAVLGDTPSSAPPRGPAGFTALLVDKTGRIAGFEGVEQTLSIPGVLGIRWMSKPGDHIVINYPENPISCFALVLATGQTQDDVLGALERAENTLRPVMSSTA